jgi:transposase InsO family protein
MEMNWNKIFGHKWDDEVYACGVAYLKYNEVRCKTNHVTKQLFKERMMWYELSSSDQIILKVYEVPHWLVSRETKQPLVLSSKMSFPMIFRVVSASNRGGVIQKFLDDPKCIALSPHALYDKIIRSQYLGVSRSFIREYLKKVTIIKMQNTMARRPIIKSFTPEFPMQIWQIDYIILDDTRITSVNDKYRYILVIIDIFSKYVYIYPTKTRSSEELAIILSKLFLSGDIPLVMGSDNEGSFSSNEMKLLYEEFNIKPIFAPSYTPQRQGFVENKNKHLKRLLEYFFMKYQSYRYIDFIDRIAFTLNNTKNTVTGFTPMHVHRGRELNVYSKEEYDIQKLKPFDYIKNFDNQPFVASNSEMYNKRTSTVKSIIKSEAIKRETRQLDDHIFLHMSIKIATHLNMNTTDIVPVIIRTINSRTSETNIIFNPIFKTMTKYKKELQSETIFKPIKFSNKLITKSSRFFPYVFKITEKQVKSTERIFSYKISDMKDADISLQRYLGGGIDNSENWTDLFYETMLLIVDDIVNDSNNMSRVKRPKFTSHHPIEVFRFKLDDDDDKQKPDVPKQKPDVPKQKPDVPSVPSSIVKSDLEIVRTVLTKPIYIVGSKSKKTSKITNNGLDIWFTFPSTQPQIEGVINQVDDDSKKVISSSLVSVKAKIYKKENKLKENWTGEKRADWEVRIRIKTGKYIPMNVELSVGTYDNLEIANGWVFDKESLDTLKKYI